jgi:hypothetical protein
MTRPTYVNCRTHRQRKEAKDADRLQPKGVQSSCLPTPCRHTDNRTVGVEAGAKSSLMLFERNMVNPTSRLLEAGVSARNAVGMAGRGCWRKPTPSCNGADRSRNTSPRKRADFQRVVPDKNAGRTFTGGNRK